MKANQYFLNRTFYKYLFPTVLSVLGGTVNVTIDSLIIGNVLGPDGLAAINICSPVYLLLCTLGSLIANGAAILSSVALGKNKSELSRSYYTQSILLLGILSLFVTVGGFFSVDLIIELLGSGSEIDALIRDYLTVTILGSAVKILLYVPFCYLRLDGRTKLVTLCLMSMVIINTGLDLLFMFKLDMGMRGAALASVIATAFAMVLGFAFLAQKKSTFHTVSPSLNAKSIGQIAVMGSPTALFNLLSALRVVVLNRVLLLYGGNEYVTIFAVLTGVSEFSLCFINGVPQTASPLIGVFSGEKDNRSVRVLMERQLLTGFVLSMLLATAISIFPDEICRLFGLDGANSFDRFALICLAVSLVFAMTNSIFTSYFNTVGRVKIANIITVMRIFVLAIVPALMLGEKHIWLFYPISEVVTLLVMLIVILITRLRDKNTSGILLLDDQLERSGKVISFSVDNDIEQVVDASERITDFCNNNDFSPKQTMAVSLSIEEILTVILENCFEPGDKHTVDIRVFKLNEVIGMRLRNAGKEFNPVRYFEDNADNPEMTGDLLGLTMITRLAQVVDYQRTFGVNSLLILI